MEKIASPPPLCLSCQAHCLEPRSCLRIVGSLSLLPVLGQGIVMGEIVHIAVVVTVVEYLLNGKADQIKRCFWCQDMENP